MKSSGLMFEETERHTKHERYEEYERHVWDTSISHSDPSLDFYPRKTHGRKPKPLLKKVKVVVLFDECNGMDGVASMDYANALKSDVGFKTLDYGQSMDCDLGMKHQGGRDGMKDQEAPKEKDRRKDKKKNKNEKSEKMGKNERTPAQKIVNKKLHTFARDWVEKYIFLAHKFLELKSSGHIPSSEIFPWNTNKSFMYAKNCIKTLYLQLVLLHYGGVIVWKRNSSSEDHFFGIESFVILRDQRGVFDSCAVPSICSKQYPAKKGLAKLWSTCGFVEKLDTRDGSLVYTYLASEREKQRKTFATELRH